MSHEIRIACADERKRERELTSITVCILSSSSQFVTYKLIIKDKNNAFHFYSLFL